MLDEGKCWCGAAIFYDGCTASEYHDPYDIAPTELPRKLYLSGPMSGYTDCNYPAFNSAAANLRSLGYMIVNPAENATGRSYRAILAEDIRELTHCEGVALLDHWWLSTGARLEVQVAGVLQMPVMPIADWINRALAQRADERAAAIAGAANTQDPR
jgi:hypothetical protein